MRGRPSPIVRVKLISGSLFGILGIVMLVRVLLIAAPWNQKVLALALPIVAIAFGAFRLREYAIARGTAP
jgi:hypothetical protein